MLPLESSEERRLCNGSGERHEACLQIGSANADPPLIDLLSVAQAFHESPDFNPVFLDPVHQVNLVLREFPVAGDLAVLIFHGQYPFTTRGRKSLTNGICFVP